MFKNVIHIDAGENNLQLRMSSLDSDYNIQDVLLLQNILTALQIYLERSKTNKINVNNYSLSHH